MTDKEICDVVKDQLVDMLNIMPLANAMQGAVMMGIKIAREDAAKKACEWYRTEHSHAVDAYLDDKCKKLVDAIQG